MSDGSMLTRDPTGQPVLLVMEPQGGSLTERMCQAMGALQWLLPNKAMAEAERIRLPDWLGRAEERTRAIAGAAWALVEELVNERVEAATVEKLVAAMRGAKEEPWNDG